MGEPGATLSFRISHIALVKATGMPNPTQPSCTTCTREKIGFRKLFRNTGAGREDSQGLKGKYEQRINRKNLPNRVKDCRITL